MTDYLKFPAGLHLLTPWQSGDAFETSRVLG